MLALLADVQQDIADKLPPKDSNVWIYAGAGVAGLVVLYVLAKMLGGKKKLPDLQKAQREDLESYPPAPAKAGPKRVTVFGVPARLRLVVVVPTGKAAGAISPDDVPELLDDVLHGLGAFVAKDKPRVKVWPAQPSVAGFAPTFHRLVQAPDAGNPKKRWLKLAGPRGPAAGRSCWAWPCTRTCRASSTSRFSNRPAGPSCSRSRRSKSDGGSPSFGERRGVGPPVLVVRERRGVSPPVVGRIPAG